MSLVRVDAFEVGKDGATVERATVLDVGVFGDGIGERVGVLTVEVAPEARTGQ